MAEMLKWQGDGLSAGLLTVASAGPGDTAPATFNGPSNKHKIEAAGVRAPRIWMDDGVSATAANVVFTLGSNRSVYAARVYFSFATLPVSGSGTLIVGRPVGSGIAWRFDITSTGAIRFRGSGGAAIDSPSTELQTGTDYRLEVIANAGACAYYVYENDATTPLYSRTSGLTIGIDFGDLIIGQSGTVVGNPRYDDISIHDTGALIGPAVLPEEPISNAYVRVSGQWRLAEPYVRVNGAWERADGNPL